MRHLRSFIFVRQGGFLYVEDGVCLFPRQVAPLLACVALPFMCALGIPFSWEKMKFGETFVWLGWQFDLCSFEVRIPESKATKFLQNLRALCRAEKKVERRLVERIVGMLLWFAGGCWWLKPWLEPLYRILQKPRAVPRLVNIQQFGEIVRGDCAFIG